MTDLEGMINFMGLNAEPVQHMPQTTSVMGPPEVFGRDRERDQVIEMLGLTIGRDNQRDQVMKQLGVPLIKGSRSGGSNGKRSGNGISSTPKVKKLKGNNIKAGICGICETACTGNVSVVLIVGIGGVGKTTLAQLIYNDPRVKGHFEKRIWVCISDFFDKRRITKEIIYSISKEEFNSPCSLDALQMELMEKLKCQKFLLVLDDIWPNAIDDWEAFYAPLRHGFEGSVILATTRYPKVSDVITTANCMPVRLDGLPAGIFWEFFKKCAFGKEHPESYPRLQDIGQTISSRLCGSPLAAKTLGCLLSKDLTEQHWRSIQKSELWELPCHENEVSILPALQLSYLYLPQELKRCFAFCSMFPKDYSFERHEIVDIWVAEGFVGPGGCTHVEDIGIRYLDELRSRFLFQTDPKFPDQTRYVMHDLIHDMAQSVSLEECCLMQDLSNHRRIPQTVRHMSVEVDGESLSRMQDIQNFNRLRSFRIGIRFDVEITWFSQLSNILYLSLKGCKLVKLSESICELNSLRYLDISYSRVQELPKKVWRLHNLQVLDARRSSLKKINQGITKIINLRHLALPAEASKALSRLSGLGNLSDLRNLSAFQVGDKNAHRISELKFMNRISGTLSIRSLCNVKNKEEAAEARLIDKQYLKALDLHWRDGGCNLMPGETEVAEALRPHSTIEHLRVLGFGGDKFPTWFKPQDLPTLRSLKISQCHSLRSLSIPFVPDSTQGVSRGDDRMQLASNSISSSKGIPCFAFTSLTSLHLLECDGLKNIDQLLTPENLPLVRSISIVECSSLESMPVHSFAGFVFLQDLKICQCRKLLCPRDMLLPSSLRQLILEACGELDKSLPACLENLNSLTLLHLGRCENLSCIRLNSMASKMLKCLVLHRCTNISTIGGLQLSYVQYVDIFKCPKLTEVEQPFVKKKLQSNDKELLKCLYISKGDKMIEKLFPRYL